MKIAITGTIGSGKSTVSNFIRELGYYVFDADLTVKKLSEKGNKAYNPIVALFGNDILNKDESINKTLLANIIFNDPNAKKNLESILHPMIKEAMIKESTEHDIFFAEIPLLFETGFDQYFDYKILVYVEDDIALDRLVLRGLNKKDAIQRINSQMDKDLKLSKSDFVIYNNSNLENLEKQVIDLIQKGVNYGFKR